MELALDIQRAWLDGGMKAVLTRAIKRFIRPALKAGSLVFTECDLRALPERPAIPGIIIREAHLEDKHLFEDCRLFLERMKEGYRCFMGIEESTGKLANYRWISTSTAYFPELKRRLILKPGEAYAFDLNTLPEFRRRGIDGYSRYYTYSHLRDTGYTKLYAYIHGDNFASLKASRHFLKPIAHVWYLQVRGCNPVMIGGRSGRLPELRKELPKRV
jgi:hypothetical protein